MQRVLVTGGAGFIGSHTVDLLLANHLQVVVLDNLASGRIDYLNQNHPYLTFIEGDILDFQLLSNIVKGCDAVLHLAALPSVPKSIDDPLASLKINLTGFVNVLEAIRQAKKAIRLVYASSAAVYGNNIQLPCNDENNLSENALSPYALDKANDERYARLFHDLFGIKSLGLRYFNVYGQRQDPESPYSGVISRFMKSYQENKPVTLFGDGTQSRDFIHVSDVARANWLALQSEYDGVLNIATGRAETLLNLISYVEQTGKNPMEIQFAPRRVGDIAHSFATTEKAARQMDFKAEWSLKQGIQSLFEMGYD
jgi:nucleoside-diphosphate-sugar epimerase